MNLRTNEKVALVLRVLMGAWFVYAGGLKIFGSGLDGFVVDIENYKLVTGGLAVAAAYIIPWVEVVAGICFMLGILRKGAWWAMLGLVLAFTVSVGSAWWRGLDISCGCLGSSEKISYWKKAAEFSLYFATLGYLAWVEWFTRLRNEEEPQSQRSGDRRTVK
ncbi:MAG: DoxX family protein [Verrucomicrobia bacterium]|nr:DoxX family protein [Verrucomicrobiota bacterium]